jgi:hypothetical protein
MHVHVFSGGGGERVSGRSQGELFSLHPQKKTRNTVCMHRCAPPPGFVVLDRLKILRAMLAEGADEVLRQAVTLMDISASVFGALSL